MNKLGIQWQRETDPVLAYNRLVRPSVLKSINCRDREFWQKLKNDNPNSIRIYRHYPNWNCWQDNPEQCAVDAVAQLQSEIGHILDLITHVEDNNEWIHSFMHAQVDAADRYMSTFIETAWNELGLRTVFLNSACGHWSDIPSPQGDDITAFWRTLQTAEWRGASLGQHEYDWATMYRLHLEEIAKGKEGFLLCGKWKRSMRAIKAAGHQGIKCIITEAGIDGGVAGQPMKGWKSVPNALENYAASLLWYNDLLNDDEDVLGASIFIISGEGMWSDFDIENSEVPARIAQFPTVPPPEPPEPNGGDMDIEIRDFDGNLQNWDWLTQTFGNVQVHPVEDKFDIKEGDHVYKVVYLWAKRGYAACVINVKDVNGNNVEGETVMWGWSGAAAHGYSDKGWNWTENGVPGDTNSTGDVGPGMGAGAYYDPSAGERGPHWCWVWDKSSDYVDGLGMLALTNHDHVDVGYQEVVWNGDEPPLPPPSGEPLVLIDEIGTILAGLKNAVDVALAECAVKLSRLRDVVVDGDTEEVARLRALLEMYDMDAEALAAAARALADRV